MATTMTAVPTENGGLQARIHEAERRAHETGQALEATRHEISGCEAMLQEISSERAQECIAVAMNKTRADPSRFDKQIQNLKDRIAGLEAIKRRREGEIAERKAELYELNAEASRIEQQRAIEAEGRDTRVLINEIENALEAHARSQRVIVEGIHKLRARRYLAEGNRRVGVDAAQRLERASVGMRA